jgi:hypothetical protein
MAFSENHDKFCFNVIYDMLKQKGPERTVSIDDTEYKIEAKIGVENNRKYILGTTKNNAQICIYDDLENDEEYHGIWIGGIAEGNIQFMIGIMKNK